MNLLDDGAFKGIANMTFHAVLKALLYASYIFLEFLILDFCMTLGFCFS